MTAFHPIVLPPMPVERTQTSRDLWAMQRDQIVTLNGKTHVTPDDRSEFTKETETMP